MKQLQSKKPILSVIVPTYNRKNLLLDCLNTLFEQTYPKNKYEIIVCDDDSTDETGDFVQKLMKTHKNLRYFKQSKQGPAAARNLGIKNVQGEIIAFTDDDCIPTKDWLEELDGAFQRNPEALGIEGKTTTDEQKADLLTYAVTNETGNKFWTCNIVYKKKALDDVGGFDEQFHYAQCEDIDLARKILKIGEVVFAPQATVFHPARKVGLFSGIKRLSYLEDEFRLFLRHRDYFSQFFPVKKELLVFLLITFCNHTWYRIRLLKDSIKKFFQNPLTWIKFLLKNCLEIFYVTLVFPRAVWRIRKWQREESKTGSRGNIKYQKLNIKEQIKYEE